MTVGKTVTLALSIGLIFLAQNGAAERWSRQVANSEWIPLTNPRSNQRSQSHLTESRDTLPSASHLSRSPPLSLSPPLQQQYQDQLLQLQKTQESIQKLLQLQEQLRVQQQLLQSQAYLPSGFNNPEDEKQALHQSTIANLQAIPQLAPEALVPPVPGSEDLPPVFSAQNFHSGSGKHKLRGQGLVETSHQDQDAEDEDQINAEQVPEAPKDYLRQGGNFENPKRLKEDHRVNFVTSSPSGQNEGDDEEIQLVYVPAETLAQRGHPKNQKGRARKQYHLRNQHREDTGIQSTTPVSNQRNFARELLEQLQREQNEKNQFFKEERMKEIARLNEEQKELERQSRLHQEAMLREQELHRQREAEKKRKELERIEEDAKQRELQRIREAREKQEQERRKLEEYRAKEQKRRQEQERLEEIERQAAVERKKELEAQRELDRQRELERQRELDHQKEIDSLRESARQKELERQRFQDESRHSTSKHQPSTWNESYITQGHHLREDEIPQAQPLIRDQQHHQHLTEVTKNVKNNRRHRLRPKIHHTQETDYQDEVTTTPPSPNQPPLSVYMETAAEARKVKVTDVLHLLKDAKTIAVLDNVGPDAPKVFVGPAYLDPPSGYAKFDLPYLSSIENNRVERKVDKLPFFVAPLSFEPPAGYSKIPFPAPHIGSVVVNTIDVSPQPDRYQDNHNPSPIPLIEPNSYVVSSQQTPNFETVTTPSYTQETFGSTRYNEPSTPSGHYSTKLKYKFFTDDKPATQFYQERQTPSVVTASTYQDERPLKHRNHFNTIPTTSSYRESSYVTPSYQSNFPQSTPRYQEDLTSVPEAPTRGQLYDPQLALVNQEQEQQRYHSQYNVGPTGPSTVNTYYTSTYDHENRQTVGPSQYNLPAELPAISPQLPGLVNALMEKHEDIPPLTTSTTTTTTSTTTTTEPPPTTIRNRGRQRGRVVPTRATTTTLSPPAKSTVEKARRPFTRSRTRLTTTTEEYRQASYEPTKGKLQDTTSRYTEPETRRPPLVRNQKFKSRDDEKIQSEISDHSKNIQRNDPSTYETIAAAEPAPSLQSGQTHSNVPVYQRDDYSPTETPIDNYSRDVINQDLPLRDTDYSRQPVYQQDRHSAGQYESNYPAPVYTQGLERQPVNGFNYQAHGEDQASATPSSLRDYSYYQPDKVGNGEYESVDTTEIPELPRLHHQDYSRYNDGLQSQSNYNSPVDNYGNIESSRTDYHQSGAASSNQNSQPVYTSQREKQIEYDLPQPTTELPLELTTQVTTTTTTTTEVPVIIRQRVRGRLGGRVQQDSAVQTRPRGSQDEFVRFSPVNQDSGRTSSSTGNRNRDNTASRLRTRIRPQSRDSPIQTEGQEYVKIQSPTQYKKPVTTSTTPETATGFEGPDTDQEYGFIRPPSFRPAQTGEKFQTVTFRVGQNQGRVSNDPNDAATIAETNPLQTQILKNRQKYPTSNRRPPGIKSTTLRTTTARTTTASPEDSAYTLKSKSRTEESKTTKSRGRVRRPGRKRTTTTTTTEASVEDNNELPLDENYPRIVQAAPQSVSNQQALYESDDEQQYSNLRNTPSRLHEPVEENYPQDFVLNFGVNSNQNSRREEYDQTQLASNLPRKYNQGGRTTKTHLPRQPSSDIYEAESQWSTKLTGNSFQPSYSPNDSRDSAVKAAAKVSSENQSDFPEIITAGPEIQDSITVKVSSDDKALFNQEMTSSAEAAMVETMDFGKKTNADATTKQEATTIQTTLPTYQEKIGSDSETTIRDASTESLRETDFDKMTKKAADPSAVRKTGHRRRKVRVRVRPADDDFVTAESQNYGSPFNSLARNSFKPNRFHHDYYFTTTESSVPTTQESSGKSILDDFFQEMLKESDESTYDITSTTTLPPDDIWITTIPPSNDEEERTTWKEQVTTVAQPVSKPSTILTKIEAQQTEVLRPENETKQEMNLDVIPKTTSEATAKAKSEDKPEETLRPTEAPAAKEETGTTFMYGKKSERHESETKYHQMQDKNSKKTENKTKTFHVSMETSSKVFRTAGGNLENEMLKETYDQDSTPSDQDSVKKSEVAETTTEDSNINSSESIHPKNHRSEWSEVKYPSDRSLYDFAKYGSWNYKNLTSKEKTKPEKKSNEETNKQLSDYVQAIFDSIKSADEELSAEQNPTYPPQVGSHQTTQDSVAEESTQSQVTTDDSSDSPKIEVDNFYLDFKTTSFPLSETTPKSEITKSETEKSEVPKSKVSKPEVSKSEVLKSEVSKIDSGESELPSQSEELNPGVTKLGKVLRTSTTTKVSHMTEICYRGRCVMTRPRREGHAR